MNSQEFNEWCVRMMERGLNPFLNPHPGETDKEFRARLERLKHKVDIEIFAQNLAGNQLEKIHSLLLKHDYQSPLRPLLEKRTPCLEESFKAPSIKTKDESIGLEMEGAFGNRLRSWNSLSELLDDPYSGLVAIRYKEPMSEYCEYNVRQEDLPEKLDNHVQKGAHPEKFFFNEIGPHGSESARIFQGEVMRTTEYLYLYYATVDKPMRPALIEDGKHETGLRALSLLRKYMEPSAFEDLQAIFDIWPNAVVEFTTFSSSCGHVVGRKSNFRRQTVFWEVREY